MLNESLLVAAKNYLDITWQDEDTDTKLTGILRRGMRYLDAAAGAPLDYHAEDKPRELLFEYAMYARSNALDEFRNNYLHELLSLQIGQELGRYDTGQKAGL